MGFRNLLVDKVSQGRVKASARSSREKSETAFLSLYPSRLRETIASY